MLPAITHVMHQPKLSRGDGPIVSCVGDYSSTLSIVLINAHLNVFEGTGAGPYERACSTSE